MKVGEKKFRLEHYGKTGRLGSSDWVQFNFSEYETPEAALRGHAESCWKDLPVRVIEMRCVEEIVKCSDSNPSSLKATPIGNGFYIAKIPECGCVVSSCVSAGHGDERYDGERAAVAEDIAGYIRNGLIVERVDKFNPESFGVCPHGNLKRRQDEFKARRAIPLHLRLAEIAINWLGKSFDNDRASVEKDIKDAISSCLNGEDACQICTELRMRHFWEPDDELCAAFMAEINHTSR